MKQLKLNDFLDYKYLSGLSYSPDGKSAAYIVKTTNLRKNGYDSHIWINKEGKNSQLTAAGDEASYCWLDSDTILFKDLRSESAKARKTAGEQLSEYYIISLSGGEAVKAFELPFEASTLSVLNDDYFVAVGRIDVNIPDYYLMTAEAKKAVAEAYEEEKDFQVVDELPFRFNGLGYTNKVRNAIFVVNRGTLEVTRISEPEEEVNDFTVLDGKLYYAAEKIVVHKHYRQHVFCYDTSAETLTCLYDGEKYQIEYMMPYKDRLILAATTQELWGYNENPMFYQLPVAGGEVTLFSANPDSLHPAVGSDCRLGRTRLGKVCGDYMYYLATIRNSVWLMKMDGEGNRTPVITKEGTVDDFDICPENDRIINVCMYDSTLQDLYSCNKDGSKCTKVSKHNVDVLKGKYVAIPQLVHFNVRDYELDGWVLMPKDFDASKKYPAILDIHGGPKVTFGETFYHEMQAWANMGYFVFYCNPVGSDGRGNEFVAMRGKYGTIDFESIMTFTDYVLANYPQIDDKRVCVTGGSYGGYMTNWIIGHTDRFCCAASQRSISNWLSFYGTSDLGFDFNVDQMGIGYFEDGAHEKWWNASPMKYAGNIVTPTVFIHATEDYRCPLSQGIQIYTSMIDRGIPARMCIFSGENHELSRSGHPKSRVRRLKEITDWFEKYTKE